MTSRSDREKAASCLASALEMSGSSHPRTDELVRVAGLLRPGIPISESARADVKARMMQAARNVNRSGGPVREDAGSRDYLDYDVHTATIALVDGQVLIADVEPLDGDRAEQVAREALAPSRGDE